MSMDYLAKHEHASFRTFRIRHSAVATDLNGAHNLQRALSCYSEMLKSVTSNAFRCHRLFLMVIRASGTKWLIILQRHLSVTIGHGRQLFQPQGLPQSLADVVPLDKGHEYGIQCTPMESLLEIGMIDFSSTGAPLL